MICTKIQFSNSQSTITGITLFPEEELFILAFFYGFNSTTNFDTYVFFCFFIIILVFSAKLSLYTSNFCGCAARSEGNTKTAKLSLMFMFSLSFFLMYSFPHQYMAYFDNQSGNKVNL